MGTPVNKNQPRRKILSFQNLKKLSKRSIIIIEVLYTLEFLIKFIIFIKINNNISYCPERIVQGKSLIELLRVPGNYKWIYRKSISESKIYF